MYCMRKSVIPVFYLQKNLLQVEEEVKKLIEKLEEDRGNHKIDEH